MLYGRIPRHIDIDGLVNTIRGNKTKKEFFRNGIVYMIARIHDEQLKDEDDNYVLINHKTIERIIGKGEGNRVGDIKNILLQNNIIEVDGTYQTKEKSYGFKIKQDYLTEDVIKSPYGTRITKSIKDILVKKEEWDEHQIELTETDQYSYINDQFERHNLSWNDLVYDDLKSIGLTILNSYDKKRGLKDKYIISLLSYVGLLVKYIKDIENRNYLCGISPSNNRFNSVLTSIPKTLRPYLKINGNEMVEIDITSSQPYFLSCILNNRFENEEQEGFNLKTIYPTLKEYFEISEMVIQGGELNNHRFFGCLFFEDYLTSIEEFCSIDFTEDFYQKVVEIGIENNIVTTRQKVKRNMMNFLFNDMEIQRDNSMVIILLEWKFKGLMGFFEGFFGSYKSRRLALLLQRVESHLILDKVVPKIFDFNKNIPVFTIHDCVLTTSEFGQDVQRIMKDTIHSVTNKPLNVKFKTLVPNRVELEEQIIDNCRIEKVKKGKKVLIRKIKTNVLRGYNFLFPEGNEDINQIINERFNNQPHH